MRELIARVVCFVTVAAVVVLAHVFAERHNQDSALQPSAPAVSDAARAPSSDVARGRQVYAELSCESCHAIGGVGNPRAPLDGVGSRRSAAELRDWITGSGAAVDQLSPAVVRRKQRYRELPEPEMNALVAFLVSLTSNR